MTELFNLNAELEKTISGANDLICTINAVGDAMYTGESAAADYVGAIRVLAETAKAHARSLEAIQMCQAQVSKANLLFKLDAELLSARAYIERTEAMLSELSEEYFDDVDKCKGTQDGLSRMIVGFEQNRIVSQIAYDYATQTRQVLDTMAEMLVRS